MMVESRRYAMVVDDSPTVRKLLAAALTELGFRVTEFASAEGCLAAMAEHGAPAVVFVDLHMPSMDGLRFIEVARTRPAVDATEIVLFTSDSSPLVQLLARRGGATFLAKPFDRGTVLDALSRAGVAIPPVSRHRLAADRAAVQR